ncbi:MAG: MATE family efflux transporter [Proteobacteria bacterium]|nr:MATE family efflux transporter [Pseudomonadota bacterium]
MRFQERLLKECKKTLKIGIPITIANILAQSMGLVDTMMTGNYSTEALAAVSGSTYMIIPFIVFGASVLGASQAIIAQMYGGNRGKIPTGTVVTQGILLGLIYALFLMPIIWFAPRALVYFGFEPQVIKLSQQYISIFIWGLPASMIFFAFTSFYAGISKPVVTMYFSLLMLIVNVVGNYALIFGNFGLPEMGSAGAAITSVVAAWSGTLGIVLFTSMNRVFKSFGVFNRLFYPNITIVRQIIKIGVPSGWSTLFEVSLFTLFSLMMGHFGVKVLAANQIVLNIASMAFMVPLSLSFALTTNVGNYLGQNRFSDARFTGFTGYLVSFIFNIVSAACFFLFPEKIAGFYTNDPELITLASELLIYAALFQLSDGIQAAGLGVLRGYKDTRIPMFANLISYWGIAVPFGYLLGFLLNFGAPGMWIGMLVGLSVAALLHTLRFHLVSRKLILLQSGIKN